jgi:archaellum component FlaC
MIARQIYRVNELQALVEGLPADHPMMKVVQEQVIQRRSAEIEQRIQEQTQEKQNHLQQLDHAIQDMEFRLESLREDAVTAEQQRDQALKAERELQEQIGRLREEAERISTELQIHASQLPTSNANGHTTASFVASLPSSIPVMYAGDQFAMMETATIWQEDEAIVTRSGNLRDISKEEWGQVARIMKTKLTDIQICASALLAGLIPSVTGGAASSLMHAFAHMITGDRTWFVPVPVTAIAPLDLFGSIDRERRMFIPAAGGLADIFMDAQKHPEELALVVLEGIDRVPGQPVYVPLFRQYVENRQGTVAIKHSTPIHLFHPRAIDPHDPYSTLAQFRWPSNILLAATCDDDMYSIQIPGICDPWLVYMEVAERKSDAHLQGATVPDASQVSLKGWQGWRQEIQHGTAQPQQAVKQHTLRQQLFYNALIILNVPKKDEVMKGNWPELFNDEADK